MKKFIFLLMILILIGFADSTCEEGQININSATLSELDELYGIGLVKAQAIINTRPYESVDDLIDVYGIGEVTLENIKSQGLACVSDEETSQIDNEEVIEENDAQESVYVKDDVIAVNDNSPKVLEAIKLISPENTKDIKSENDENKIDISNYAIYGLIAFCVLLGVLFLIKFKKKQISKFDE